MRHLLPALLLAAAAPPLAGQGLPVAPDAIRRHVEALAHDSARGRATPGPELEKAAAYVAGAFRAAGLAPGGDDGGYFARFPVSETLLDPAAARVEVRRGPTWALPRDVRWAGGLGGSPVGTLRGPVVVVHGAPATPEELAGLELGGSIVVYLMPRDSVGRVERSGWRTVLALARRGPVGILVPSSLPDSAWLASTADREGLKPAPFAAWDVWTEHRERSEGVIRFLPFLEVRDPALAPVLAAHGIDLVPAPGTPGPLRVRPVPGLDLALRFDRRIERVAWPANVVGILPGSDPALRHEHVLVTAHLDGLGLAPGGGPEAERILNGADDNASGTAALLELAGALARARPRRSIVFAAVSGEENGLWGSDWLAARPPVPHGGIVANLNADMIGRPARRRRSAAGPRSGCTSARTTSTSPAAASPRSPSSPACTPTTTPPPTTPRRWTPPRPRGSRA